MTGDFNIHLDVVDDRDMRRLAQLLDTFGLSQLVSVPTYRDGHTLNINITRADLALFVVDIHPMIQVMNIWIIRLF